MDNRQKATNDGLQNWGRVITGVESQWEKQYEEYFEEDFISSKLTPEQIAKKLREISRETGKKPAVLWVMSQPKQLNLLLITPQGAPVSQEIRAADRETLSKVSQDFVEKLSNLSNGYLASARLLHRWLISPIEPYLEAEQIDTLIMCLGGGLRTLPFAALYDGERFLIEKYSLTRIPGFYLTPISHGNLSDAKVLAMGATEFEEQVSLPAVAVELSAITPDPWQGKTILNEGFTVENLEAQRDREPFQIIHLATHADFVPGKPRDSYIQFSDRKLTLDQLNELGWKEPPVELLVLSACQTAVGDRTAEMGFAGLALQSGVRSALASLWYVSDAGTLALMSEFYQQLKNIPLKAEALRQTQIAMLKGKVYLRERELVNSRGDISLPPALAESQETNLSHPFYWASFTLIGSPW
ncbi:MAG: CHAT domain-containing protein [Hydrococcus sp. C42_A2020_068]|nr:CHAT domain-containing protein [Hydrococcus sp. C42_A2020_068]